MSESNRVKTLVVPREDILDLLGGNGLQCGGWPDKITVSRLALPPGTSVAAVEYEMPSRAFLFLLSNPAWPEVPVGTRAPEFHASEAWGREYKVYEKVKAEKPPKTLADVVKEHTTIAARMGWVVESYYNWGGQPTELTLIRPGSTERIKLTFYPDGALLRETRHHNVYYKETLRWDAN